MATYVNNLRLKEITTGDEDGTWGTSTNTNLELITDGFSYGTKEIAADANETFTMPDATADATRSLYLKFTSAVSLTATREITLGPNTVSKTWIIENATSGSQIITIKQGSGATVNVPNGSKVMVVTDGAGAGAAVLNANPTEAGTGTVTSVGGTGTVNGITLTGTVTSSGNLTLGGTLANVDLTTQVTGTLPIANGGTGTTSTTFANLTTNVTGTLPVANGGTGATTLTANNVLLGNGTSAPQAVAPSTSGNVLTSNGSTWVSSAAPSSDPTLGTLTKTFTAGESSTINLTSSVLAPVVSVTKEIPQSGVTNNNWDVNSTTENYTRLNSAPATTLDFVGFYVSGAIFVDSFSIAAQDTEPRGLAFSTDGTKMFVVGSTGDDVNEYTLSTGFDVSTASFVDSFSVAGQDTSPQGIAFNTNGTKMFVVGFVGQDVNEYTLSTGFDVSTASFVDSFNVSAEEIYPSGIAFNTDGTKMFIVGTSGDDVNEYALSTGFDVSTSVFVDSFSVAGQESLPQGIAFNPDGTKMFIVGTSGDDINQYSLSTGFDVSTATFVTNFSVQAVETEPRSVAFNTDGTKMFIVGSNGDDVNEYTLPLALALGTGSFASADIGKTIEANDGVFVLTATDGSIVETTAPTSYDQVASGSWEMYGVVYNAADGDLELSNYTNGYDLTIASYGSVSFSVASQETTPTSAAFSADGTKMFVIGESGDDVNEYTLSTAWDVSTASYSQNFSVSSQDTEPQGLNFNNDGTKMFFVGDVNNKIYEYALSTAWDVSTASFTADFTVTTPITKPFDLAFNNDGTKVFILDEQTKTIYEYTMSTPFDVTTMSLVDGFSVSSQDSNSSGFDFNSDGTKLFMVGYNTDRVYQYSLSTAFDISTASYSSINFSVNTQDTDPRAIRFSSDGTKMYIVGNSQNTVFEYSTGAFYFPTGYQPVHTTSSIDTTYWTDINSMTADQAAGDGNIYYAISTDDRTTWTVIDNTDGERDIVRNNAGTWQYNSNGTYASETWVNGATNTELATLAEAMEGAVGGYGLASASYDSVSFNSSGQTSLPIGLVFNNDGTKMFIADYSGQDINEYTLSSAFDITTASFVDSFSVSSQETQPAGMAFNTDGTKMFVVGLVGDDVNEYTLSTGFDVSTASFVDSFSVSAQDTQPAGVKFNTDGTKMFVVGYTNDAVYEYNLSTGFDVSSASFVDSFSVSAQAALPIDLAFNTDGTKMFIVDYTGQDVNEYSLSTAFDISTASFDIAFSVSSQDTQPRSVAFNENGSKMFLLGSTNYSVYQYSTVSFTKPNGQDSTRRCYRPEPHSSW
jgi:hypothetical protein